jgi:hypothetical protein
MTQLTELMHRHSGFGFSSQYVLAEGPWNSVLAFHNYFEEVFPGRDVSARLHLVFHDAAGRETGAHAIDVAAGAAIQIDCRALGVPSDGVVAMAAVPDTDLTALTEGKFKIKSRVTTGYYITWEHAGRWRDTMHEWAEVGSIAQRRSVQHVGFAAAGYPIDCGLVLTNPTCAADGGAAVTLRLRSADGRMAPKQVPLEALAPMGSRVVRLNEHFPNFDAQLAQYGSLVVDVESTLAGPPLTFEWHRSGDFHIHHI